MLTRLFTVPKGRIEIAGHVLATHPLRALASLGHWPAAARVAALLHDPIWDVRRQAALGLRAIGAPGTIYLRRLRDSDDLVAAAVARYALDLAAAGATA